MDDDERNQHESEDHADREDEEDTPPEVEESPEDDSAVDEDIDEEEDEDADDDEGGPSLYNFDLHSVEGVDRIMTLLPILDEEIVKAVYQECFPGYPLDNITPRIARIELRGFFMDFLNGEQAV